MDRDISTDLSAEQAPHAMNTHTYKKSQIDKLEFCIVVTVLLACYGHITG